MPDIPVMKIFLAGEGGVGKSTMVERFITGYFNPNMILTIGVNHGVKNMTTSDGRDLTLQIWDLGGEDRFRFVVRNYVKGSSAGLVVFDTTRYSSYLNLSHWLDIIREILPETPIFLVGAKVDIEASNRDPQQYQEILKKYHLKDILFTSSKTGEKVDHAFQMLADCLPSDPHFYRKESRD
jgi:Ras-related protein Rab-11A